MILRLAGTYVHLLEIPLLLFLAGAATLRLVRNGLRLQVTNLAAPLLLFSALVLYLCAIALSSWNALDVRLVLKSGLKWTEVVVLISLVFLYVQSQEDFALIYWALAVSGILAIVRVAASVIAGQIPLFGYRVFPGPEALFALALVLPFVRRDRGWSMVATGLCLLSAVLSMSRIVWVALPLLLFLAHRYRLVAPRHFSYLIAGTIGILLFLLVAERNILLYRWSELFAPRHVSNVERMLLLKTAVALFVRHPLVGIGSLNFPRALVQQGHLLALAAPDPDVLEPHNAFLQVLAEEGVLGFAFFSFSLVAVIVLLRFCSRASGVSRPYRVGLGVFWLTMGVYLLFGFISAQFRFFLGLGYGLAAATVKVLPEVPDTRGEVEGA
ncbi:MAG: O-antigen ligase family protein [Calditrichaeota bacterium]|nr:O-antigen ligase family protein [Calditrichota bacterium]